MGIPDHVERPKFDENADDWMGEMCIFAGQLEKYADHLEAENVALRKLYIGIQLAQKTGADMCLTPVIWDAFEEVKKVLGEEKKE